MPNATFRESGTNATQDFTFYATTSGTVASATDQLFTGPRSIKFSTGAGSADAFVSTPSILADAGNRISVRYFFSAIPAASSLILESRTVGSTIIGQLRIGTDNKLYINLNDGTAATAGAVILAINTWYRFTFSFVVTNATTYQFKSWINGVADQTRTNGGTLVATGSDNLLFGAQGNFGANVNAWAVDIFVDNGTDLGDPGDIRVAAKRPFANGTTNNFTASGTTSSYGSGNAPRVNQQPLDQAGLTSFVGAGPKTDEYNIENQATGDHNTNGSSIIDVMGWVFAKALIAETGKIIVDGTQTNIALTSTPTLFTQSSVTPTVFPAGTGADIGIVTDPTITTTSLYEAGVLISFIDQPMPQGVM